MSFIEASPENKVLVTGANGYLGMWIVHHLLKDGYSVRGAVRSSEKGRWVASKFPDYKDRLEWTVVEDITKEGAFDEAVKDVVAIEHVASPLSPGGSDPDLVIKPAVEGTLGILTSAMNHGKQIKRIVITSSCGAIDADSQESVQVYDESNWGDAFVQQVKKLGKDAPFMSKYKASKTLAERAAWNFCRDNKDKISWDLVALNPSFILGGSYLDTDKPEKLTSSLHGLYHNVFHPERARNARYSHFSYLHVKDASRLHVQALNTPDAGGQRIILSAAASTWGKAAELTGELYPELVENGSLPSFKPDIRVDEGKSNEKIDYPAITSRVDYRNDKSKAIFGVEYIGFQECIQDSIEYFISRGFFDKK